MSDYPPGELIACHECDALHQRDPIPPGARASCYQCGCELYRHIPHSLNRTLALYLSTLLLFVLANCFPFLSLQLGGRVVQTALFSGGWTLYQLGMPELGLLVFLTSVIFPLVAILGMLYLLIPAVFGVTAPGIGMVYRLVHNITPWSLIGVFLLGVLIAVVKLQDLADVIPGVSMYALAALLLVYSAARASFEPHALWQGVSARGPALTADEQADSYLNCHSCGWLMPADAGLSHCGRCASPLHHRIPHSLQKTWALLFSATLLYVPANLYPVMTVIRFGQGEPSTILGGVLHLIEEGMWGLAMIVFFASVVVPSLKLLILAYLLISVQKKSDWRARDRTQLYRVTEVVGAWSMVDIFLVGLLSALVSLDALSTIRPGLGASYFAAVVVLTMFAAHSFDPRLIWDNNGNRKNKNS
jgi:paraquat-inducible protein A